MLDDLPAGRRIVGTKQVIKSVETGASIRCVYVARDADEEVKLRIIDICNEHNVEARVSLCMNDLGTLCGIDVGAACVALLN